MFNIDDVVTYINPIGNTHTIATITQRKGNTVYFESGEFGGMGPFLMTFNAETGLGVGEYMNTMIVKGARDLPTHTQLGIWIEKHTDITQYNDVMAAMIRFCACEEARTMLHEISISEFATMLIDGITGTSKTPTQSVDDWLIMWYEQYLDEDDDDVNALLITKLKLHFDLKATA